MSSQQPERDVGEPLFLTYKEAARKINISMSWLYHLLREGELTSVPLGPQVRRIAMDECEEYAKRKIAEAKAKRAPASPASPASGTAA